MVERCDARLRPAREFLRGQRVANHRLAQDVGEVIFGHLHAQRFRYGRGGVNLKASTPKVAGEHFSWMMGGG